MNNEISVTFKSDMPEASPLLRLQPRVLHLEI
jgi:hypothetical protein